MRVAASASSPPQEAGAPSGRRPAAYPLTEADALKNRPLKRTEERERSASIAARESDTVEYVPVEPVEAAPAETGPESVQTGMVRAIYRTLFKTEPDAHYARPRRVPRAASRSRWGRSVELLGRRRREDCWRELGPR